MMAGLTQEQKDRVIWMRDHKKVEGLLYEEDKIMACKGGKKGGMKGSKGKGKK
jgi:hypothetical protein